MLPGFVIVNQQGQVERWLKDQVGAAYDVLEADPSRSVTAAQVRARLAAEHKRGSTKK